MIVLVDVDYTLIDGNNNYNHGLINFLIQAGLTDIYLFTDMSASDAIRKHTHKKENIPYTSREDLIKHLESKGFQILGVITPADPSYQQGLGAAFTDFIQPLYCEETYQDVEKREELRKGYAEFHNQSKDKISLFQTLEEDEGSNNDQPTSIKALMYRAVSKEYPANELFLFFDDAKHNLVAVEAEQNRSQNSNTLITVEVNKSCQEDAQAYCAKLYSRYNEIQQAVEKQSEQYSDDPNVKKYLERLLDVCDKQYDSDNNKADSIRVLLLTEKFLSNPNENQDRYMKSATKMKGAYSTLTKTIGIVMIGLGLAVISAVVSPIMPIVSVPLSVGVAVAGIGAFIGGIFAYRSAHQRNQISSAMKDVDKHIPIDGPKPT